MSPHITLLIIDPQNDFVDPHGSLAVTGALEDAERLVKLIEEAGDRIHSIALSLDSHQRFDISHPLWFSDKEGRHPAPFTVITEQDLVDGTWNPPVELLGQTRTYLRALEQQGRYPHMIWPEHCLIGSEGHAVFPLIQEALQQWSSRPARIDYIYKGQNPLTEHFSAVEAEVPDTKDPRTQVNKDLIDQLNESDEVWVSGWARSHCVGNTLRDLYKWGGRSLAKKIVIINDTMSDVTGFESLGESVLKDSLDLGVRVTEVEQLIRF